MSSFNTPHASAALRHLRFGVTFAGGVVALVLLAQVLIWGFAHFTDVGTEQLVLDKSSEPLVVVGSSGEKISHAPEAEAAGAEVNEIETSASVGLRRASDLVQTVGVLSALLLCLLMLEGVIIAGGSNVPGVELAVTACTWAIVIMLLAVPWNGVIEAMSYPGVFQSYDTLVAYSEAQRSGDPSAMSAGAFYGMHLLLPLLLAVGAAASVVRFRIGIERGVIVTHASQLDEKLEKEIRDRRTGELTSPRSVGALNQAIGLGVEKEPEVAPAAAAPPQMRSPMSARPDEAPASRPI